MPAACGCLHGRNPNQMRRYWKQILDAIEGADSRPDLPVDAGKSNLPTICLLGKTGAGKSSLIKLLTGASDIEIGNGFEPCTRHARLFRHPNDEPVLQFMDMRGIGEEGYDPEQDLASLGGASQVAIAVARVDDRAQGELCEAVRSIRRRRKRIPIFVVHNRADAVFDPEERETAVNRNHAAIERAAGRKLRQVLVGAFDDDGKEDARRRVFEALAEELPRAAFVLESEQWDSGERREFARVRMQVAQNATLAGATGWIPGAGLATVPAIQARMLLGVARHYGIDFNRKTLLALSSALGAGTAAGFAATHVLRQAGTIFPGYGQTAGAVVAGASAFATTFALGRASAYYFYHEKEGSKPDIRELRKLYKSALTNARHSYRKSD